MAKAKKAVRKKAQPKKAPSKNRNAKKFRMPELNALVVRIGKRPNGISNQIGRVRSITTDCFAGVDFALDENLNVCNNTHPQDFEWINPGCLKTVHMK